jgi:DNA polymerase V
MGYSILGPLESNDVQLSLYSFKVPAGLPSPAADHIEKHLSLDELFEIRAPHVYLVKIEGDSMEGAGIFTGDLVIVDCSRDAGHGDIVIAALNNEPVCKRLYMRDDHVILQSENPRFPSRHVMEGDELAIWGVVRYSIRDHEKNTRSLHV